MMSVYTAHAGEFVLHAKDPVEFCHTLLTDIEPIDVSYRYADTQSTFTDK